MREARGPARKTASVLLDQVTAVAFGRESFAATPGGIAADAAGLPTRIKIAHWGSNKARTHGITFKVGAATMTSLANNQARLGRDKIALDFEHQTVPEHKNFLKPPHDVAGHGAVEVVEGEGIYLNLASYTPAGQKFAPNYPDVSGYFTLNKDGEVILVESVALCQAGDVDELPFDQARAFSAFRTRLAASLGTSQIPLHLREGLIKLLRADPNSTDADLDGLVAQALTDMGAKQGTATAAPAATPTPAAPAAAATPAAQSTPTPAANPNPTPNPAMSKEITDAVNAAIAPLSQKVDQLISDRANGTANSGVEAAFSAAQAEGKVIPASLREKNEDGSYKLPAATVKDILTHVPKGAVPTGQRTPEHVAATTLSEGTGNEGEVELVRVAMGISPEAWKKGGISKGDKEVTKQAAAIA